MLPGDVPAFIQRLAEATLRAYGIENPQLLAAALFLAAPDIFNQAAAFFTQLAVQTIPKDLAKTLDQATELYDKLRPAMELAELLHGKGALAPTLQKLKEIASKASPELKKALEGVDIASMVGAVDKTQKLLASPEVAKLLEGKVVASELRKAAEVKAKEIVRSGLEQSLRNMGGESAARIFKAAGDGRLPNEFRGEVTKAWLSKVQTTLPAEMRDVVDAVVRAPTVEAARKAMLESELGRQVKRLNPTATSEVIANARAAIREGDHASAWQLLKPFKLSEEGRRFEDAASALFQGEPRKAANLALRGQALAAGLTDEVADLLLGKGHIGEALSVDLIQRTGLSPLQLRALQSPTASVAAIEDAKTVLRGTSLQSVISELDDPVRRLQAIRIMYAKREQEIVREVARGTGQVPASLADLLSRRDAIGDDLLKLVEREIVSKNVLRPEELILLREGNIQEAARRSLGHAAKGAHASVLASYLAGETASATVDATYIFRTAVRETLGAQASKAQVDALIDKDVARLADVTIDRWVASVGFDPQSASDLIQSGNLASAIGRHAEKRVVTPALLIAARQAAERLRYSLQQASDS